MSDDNHSLLPQGKEEDARRRKYERRVRHAALLAILSLLGAVFYLAQLLPAVSLPDLPDVATPFSALSGQDPSVNPYRTPGLPEAQAAGVVTAIVPRTDRMPDGSWQKNYYARTEYYLERYNSNCFFHHYLGPDGETRYSPGQGVTVSYQPQVQDVCGSSMIIE